MSGMANIFNEVNNFSNEQGVNKTIDDMSLDYAHRIVRNMLDPDNYEPIEEFPKIDIHKTPASEDEYIMVHDFFKMSDLQFPAQVLSFESQHPEFKYNRKEVCKRFGLDANNNTPMLVQMLKLKSKYSKKG